MTAQVLSSVTAGPPVGSPALGRAPHTPRWVRGPRAGTRTAHAAHTPGRAGAGKSHQWWRSVPDADASSNALHHRVSLGLQGRADPPRPTAAAQRIQLVGFARPSAPSVPTMGRQSGPHKTCGACPHTDRPHIERRAGLAPAFPRRKRGVFPWTTNATPADRSCSNQLKINCTRGRGAPTPLPPPWPDQQAPNRPRTCPAAPSTVAWTQTRQTLQHPGGQSTPQPLQQRTDSPEASAHRAVLDPHLASSWPPGVQRPTGPERWGVRPVRSV